MQDRRFVFGLFMVCMLGVFSWGIEDNCSSFLVSKGASQDGSVMITYSCDGEFLSQLRFMPAEDHEKDSFADIKDWNGNVRGRVKQPAHTYAVVGLMNDHQLAIGETTFGGRPELENPEGLLDYYDLMLLALQRATTAREAITAMAALVDEYGYSGPGESLSIADKNEAWIMEMIGPGPKGKGAVWVALRVPDGYICGHANMSRIGEFPLHDPDNCLYAQNVISLAEEKGFYSSKSGKPFSFCLAYDPPKPESMRACATRVWSMFRRSAPSQNFSTDFCRGTKNAAPYPLWIKPDKKLSLTDVAGIMRDHYEGTDFDMTLGIDAGPYGCPIRDRDLTWKVSGEKYSWERSISTQQAAFSFISQSRSWLPDPIGGVYWYGVDDTYTTCYVPLYCSIQDVPGSFTRGDIRKFSWDSAWWVFNFVANFANLKYSYMIKDIQEVQKKLEGHFLAMQPVIEKTAQDLWQSDPSLMVQYLTQYSVSGGEMVVKKWIELGEFLISKYNDGYIKDEKGWPRSKGYPEKWLEEVVKSRPKQFLLPKWGDDKKDGRLH